MMPVDSAAPMSSLNSVASIDGGAENTPWNWLSPKKNDRIVTPMMPIRIAPRTRRWSSVTIVKKPTIARIVSCLCRSPSVTSVAGLPTITPDVFSEMMPRNRPIPAVIEIRSDFGMPLTIASRTRNSVTSRNSSRR